MRNRHGWGVAALFSLVVASAPAAAQNAAAPRTKEAAVRELMALTGAADLGRQTMLQMIPPLKQAIPDAPDGFWDAFMAEVDPNELVELVVPVYLKYFTQQEVEQLIAFYKTPVGRKLVSSMAPIMRECMSAGESWGRQLAERAIRKLKANPPPKS